VVTRIAVLGAECTGKTQLTQALLQTYLPRGEAVVLVPEVLRSWCAQAGRTPQAHEQAQIAHAQAAALEQALASISQPAPLGPAMPQPAAQNALVISDTSALMTAVYSDVLFNDASLYPWALAQQRQFDLTLVMGLDLPWVSDGIQRDGPRAQAQIDARLRQVLENHGVVYTVVYGAGPRRLESALQAIGHERAASAPHAGRTASNWQWSCEKCSDAGCEHQLFSALLRASAR
jgi:HTH-type transcriptional repressor of NAD biosynthesis genes